MVGTGPAARGDAAVADSTALALSIGELTKVYDSGVRALNSVNLDVPAGSFFGLLGPNGAGKSTLMRAISGLVRVTSGSISVFGYDALASPVQARRLIGLAPQEPNLDRFLTVRETLQYHAGYYGVSRSDARVRADEMMETFDLTGKADSRPMHLSGGMRRRLLLARAFMHDPPLVMLDEPTAGVDVELRHELWEYIRRVHRSGRTIVLTTHYLEEAEMLCDDIALIRTGEIVARASPEQLMQTYGADSLEQVYLQVVGR